MLLVLGIVIWRDNVEMVKVLVWPVFSFAGLAFGLDWKGKQDAYMVSKDFNEPGG